MNDQVGEREGQYLAADVRSAVPDGSGADNDQLDKDLRVYLCHYLLQY